MRDTRARRNLDGDLEGARSLGAVLGDGGFVWSQQDMRPALGLLLGSVGSLLGSTAARDRSPPGQERPSKP